MPKALAPAVACLGAAGAGLAAVRHSTSFALSASGARSAAASASSTRKTGHAAAAIQGASPSSGLTPGSRTGYASLAAGAAALACTLTSARRQDAQRFQMRSRRPIATQAAPKKLTVPSELLDSVDIFIFDCDGVIWLGDSVIDGIPNVLDELRKAGKTIFFVTNNSTKSRAGYKKKFTSLGLDVKPEEIFSSSFAAAAYMEQTKFKDTGKKVYVIGETGIGEELDLIGVPWFGAESDKDVVAPLQPGGKVDHDHNVGAVIVGFDRNINYYKLQYAQLCLNENPGCQFIATNLDRVTHLTDAQEWAGNGTMVGAIKGCTGMEPNVVGKPAPLMIDYIAEKYNVPDRSRICMVGDRLDTDVAFGRNNGLRTCLTLCGVTSEDELLEKAPRKAGTEGIQPDFYVKTINDFLGGGAGGGGGAPAAPAAGATISMADLARGVNA